jgi:hypothetical protein
MTIRLPAEQTRYLRLRSQRLVGPEREARTGALKLLEHLCGVQAQEPLAASLALRVRGRGLTAGAIEKARMEECSIARTWCMRGTLHLLASEDLAWLLPLMGPVSIRKSARRYAQLGLDEDKSRKAIWVIRELLAREGAMTRAELAGGLTGREIAVEGQAVYHLIRRAGLAGLLCYGPDREREPTYVLLEGTNGQRDRPEREALAELAVRYLAAYGPADPKDLARWSGLTISQARTAFKQVAAELVEVEIDGQAAWIPESRVSWLDDLPDDVSWARLLPAYDALLLGYDRRDWIVPDDYARRVHPGGGVIRATLLLDGQVAGIWRTKRGKSGVTITVEPFESLPAGAVEAIREEVQDIGRFLGTKAVWAR